MRDRDRHLGRQRRAQGRRRRGVDELGRIELVGLEVGDLLDESLDCVGELELLGVEGDTQTRNLFLGLRGRPRRLEEPLGDSRCDSLSWSC